MDCLFNTDLGIDLYGATVDGNAQIAQRCANRIDVPRGGLLGDSSIGVSVDAYMGSVNANAETLAADLSAEIQREPGAEDGQVIVVSEGPNARIEIRLPFAVESLPAPGVPRVRIPPEILAVSPGDGPIAGGTVVTITGAHFENLQSVLLGGAPPAIVTQEDDQTLRIVTAPASSGLKTLVVETLGGTATLPNAFEFTTAAAPTISAVNVSRISTYGGTTFIVTGTNLATVSAVTLGGTACTILSATSTTATVKAPVKAAGVYAVAVTTPAGTATLAAAITVFALASKTLSALFEGNDFDSGTGAWPGTSTPGGSGGFNLGNYGTIPTVTALPSARTGPRANAGGTGGFTGSTLAAWLGANAGTLVFAMKINGAYPSVGGATDAGILMDAAGFVKLTAGAGPTMYTEFDASGSPVSSAEAGFFTVAVRWNKSLNKLQTRFDGGAWVDRTKSNSLTLTGSVYLALNPVNGGFVDVHYGLIAASLAVESDAEVSDMERAAADYVGI
jgi:hypothetical protein